MRTTRTILPLLAVTATALTLAGCGAATSGGGGGAQPSSASPAAPAAGPASSSALPAAASGDAPDPCTAVTAAFVSDLIGKPVTVKRATTSTGRACTYETGAGTFAVILDARPATQSDFDDTVATAAKKGERGTSVPGYGTSAEQYPATADRGPLMLEFDKGAMFTILGDGVPIEQLEQVAVQYDRAL